MPNERVKVMDIKHAYKGLPIGFSSGVTHTNEGTIHDVYYVTSKRNFFIGRIGKWDSQFFNGPTFNVTPTGYSPFVNHTRRFTTRKEAAIYLLGLYDRNTQWMADHIRNPRCAVCNTSHAIGDCPEAYGVDTRN